MSAADFYREEQGKLDDFRKEQAQNLNGGTAPASVPFPEQKPAPQKPIPYKRKTIPPDFYKTMKKSTTKGPTAEYRRERERVLSQISSEALVQRLIQEEYQAKETRKLLKNAIAQLQLSSDRLAEAEEEKAREAVRELKTSQSVFDAQQEAVRMRSDMQLYKEQLNNAQREIRRAQETIRNLEAQRNEAERAASKAKSVARKLNEEKAVMSAREEGRRQGFEEGMHHGRMLTLGMDSGSVSNRYILDRAYATPLGSGEAFIEEYPTDVDLTSSPDDYGASQMPLPHEHIRTAHAPPHHRTHRTHGRRQFSLDSTPRDIHGRGPLPPRRTTSTPVPGGPGPGPSPATAANTTMSSREDVLRVELDAVRRQAEEAARRTAEQQEMIRRLEEREAQRQRDREAEVHRERELQAERERERVRAAEWEKERQVMLAREAEREAAREREREAERAKERERQQERDAERQREMARERERAAEAERERELQREVERERDRQMEAGRARQEERNKEKGKGKGKEVVATLGASTSTAPDPQDYSLPYFPMPRPLPTTQSQPPIQVIFQTSSAPTTTGVGPPTTDASGSSGPVIPPAPSQQPSGAKYAYQRTMSSPDTQSSSGLSQMAILSQPAGKNREDGSRGKKLSIIPESPSDRTSVSNAPPVPSWVHNPPVDCHSRALAMQDPGSSERSQVEQWRRSTSESLYGGSNRDRDYLSPSAPNNPRGHSSRRSEASESRKSRTGSSTSTPVDITVVPPSRPASGLAQREVESSGYLSPNHTPRSLLPDSREPPVIPVLPPDDRTSSVIPPSFVPQSFVPTGSGFAGSPSGFNQPLPPHGGIYANPNAPGASSGAAPYVPPPPTVSSSSNIYSGVTTPRSNPMSIYAPPASSSYSYGAPGGPVVPPSPRSGPSHFRAGSAAGTPRVGILKNNGSAGSVTSEGRRLHRQQTPGPYGVPSYDDDDEDTEIDDEDVDAATARNTRVNSASASAVGALPIPPPSFRYP